MNEQCRGKKLWKVMQRRRNKSKLSYRLTFNVHYYLESLNKIACVITRDCTLLAYNSVTVEWHI